ncbi:hypothetical protein AO380_1514 [Moraxella catarrhalis]|nr:hypothetical protein AO380_1514 [Moraxella catarrhalis]
MSERMTLGSGCDGRYFSNVAPETLRKVLLFFKVLRHC